MTIRSLLGATILATLPMIAPALAADLQFAPIEWARTDAEKAEVRATDKVMIEGKEYPIGFNLLARSGDKIGDGVFGALTDMEGKVVKAEDGSEHLSVDADFSSLIRANGKLYNITHFESRPGAMYVSEVQQDADGKLSFVSTKPVEFKDVHGLWVPCAGSVTPWETHLGSEEYPADAEKIEAAKEIKDLDEYMLPMAAYFGKDPAKVTLDEFREVYNPYAYGYPVEVSIDANGNAKAVKHYAMGRRAVELAKVMPDQKTAYVSDDGTNVILTRFVADKEAELSAGTLYAAAWKQTSADNGGAADLEWIELGHATDAEVKALIEQKLKFSDIFEKADLAEDGTCAEGFSASNAEGVLECLKVKDGMEQAAAFLETRRYASMKGATAEFRKMEGITYNADANVAYVAMSEIEKGMEKGHKGDLKSRDAVQLEPNKCGGIYELALDEGFTATKMKAILTGKPVKLDDAAKTKAADPSCDAAHMLCGAAAEANTCDLDGIANPDNLTFIPGTDTLIIGEDTGDGHQNDVIWSYNLGQDKLTRIFSTPFGSETTSPYFYPDLNGHGYLMAVVQHPYGESDEDKLKDAADARAYVGYIGPFPAMAGAAAAVPAAATAAAPAPAATTAPAAAEPATTAPAAATTDVAPSAGTPTTPATGAPTTAAPADQAAPAAAGASAAPADPAAPAAKPAN